MARKKSKGSSENNVSSAPTKEQPTTGSVSEGGSLPNLSETVLAGLTKNIEQRLMGTDNGKSTPEKFEKAAPKHAKKEKKEKVKVPPQDGNKAGKKRDRNGEVIAAENREPQTSVKQSDSVSENLLEKEIYAIGGSKEDYDLLAGVESDSEIEETSKASGKNNDEILRKDLARLLEGTSDIEEPTEKKSNDKGSNEKKPAARKASEAPKEPAKPAPSKHTREDKPARKEELRPQKLSPKLVIAPRPDWYSAPLPFISTDSKPSRAISRQVIDEIREYGRSLLEAESKTYSESQQSSSQKFYSTIMSSGTLSDKISALTLAVQESPIHNIKALESLVGLARKRSRAQAVEVLRSLKDLFAQGTLLPSDRRLKSLANQPTLISAFTSASSSWTRHDPLPGGLQPGHIIVLVFENFLKEQYFEVLKILEVWCGDEIEFSRSRAVSYVYELLKEKPEQESNLLRLLVNKLGDPSRKIASRASYLLLQLQLFHPLMKPTVISAVESDILFRPSQSQHARYYAIITLNQTVLNKNDEGVAVKLLDIYFGFFITLLKSPKTPSKQTEHHKSKGKGKKQNHIEEAQKESHNEQLREKLVSGILTGINRAYPFTQSDFDRLTKHVDTLFRITHSSNFNTSIQALMLIQQLSSSHQILADRFYRTLYESLLDPRITISSKQSMYLNLIYKSLKSDLNVKRVKAFVKRLVQILSLHHPSFICGVLYMIRELEKTFPSLSSLMDDPEDYDDDNEVFKDVDEDGDTSQAATAQPSTKETEQSIKRYDSRKRDPEHSNADKSCLWEILPYLSHFHPSVSVNADYLLNHQAMAGKPDLTIHTLTHFLDRFVYRNPKSTPGLRGASIMQPLAGGDTSGLLVTASGRAKNQEPVNSEAFWRKRSDEVAAEDVFFHTYFNRLGEDKTRKQKPKKKTAPDGEGEEDESEAESEIWKALVESRPDLEDEQDSDDGLDLDDLDSAMGDEDDNDDDAEDDGGVIFNDESDEDVDEEKEQDVPKIDKSEDAGDDDDFDMDVSDDDAFRDSDEDIPLELGGDVEDIPEDTDKGKSSQRQKKRKLKHLPTFASVEDYAALLDKEDDDV